MTVLGETLERYRVQELLGEGSDSAVYKVCHEALGSTHALKVLQVSSDLAREQLLREGRAQACVHHPNLVAATDVIEVTGRPALLLEYVDGPTLEEWLSGRRPSLEESLEVFRGIVRGVGALHRAGFVHRDLKPSNVLLATTEAGIVPKVADFGLVRELGSIEPEGGEGVGTVGYMAPEQLHDPGHVDERADLFALGCILYELVTGRPAFEGADVVALSRAVREAQFTPVEAHVPDLPPAVVDTIGRLLRATPSERFRSCAELVDHLYGGKVRLPGTTDPDERAMPARAPLTPLLPDRRRYPSMPPLVAHAVPSASRNRSAVLAAVGIAVLSAALGYLGLWLEPAATARVTPSPVATDIVVTAPVVRVPLASASVAGAPTAAVESVLPELAVVTPVQARPRRPFGTVRIEGDGEVVIADPEGRVVAAGPIEPGTWTWTVRFGAAEGLGGTFELADGQELTLRCSSFAMRCTER